MFSTFYLHTMGFEYFAKTLESELENRSKIQEDDLETAYSTVKYYSESEIWYIINVLCSVVGTFKDQDYPHGDIQPKNIMIDNEGQMKILDSLLINYGETGYKKMIFNSAYKAPLSPLLLEAYTGKVLGPEHDKVKSDIWSIGITVLCAANNTNFNRYYDWNIPAILNHNAQLVNPKLNDTVGADLANMKVLGFSDELVHTVKTMLSVDEVNRPDIDFLLGFLNERVAEEVHNS